MGEVSLETVSLNILVRGKFNLSKYIYITYVYIYIYISAEGSKNVSLPWLSLLRGWGSLTMAFTGKFADIYIYIYIYIIISVRSNPCTNQT